MFAFWVQSISICSQYHKYPCIIWIHVLSAILLNPDTCLSLFPPHYPCCHLHILIMEFCITLKFVKTSCIKVNNLLLIITQVGYSSPTEDSNSWTNASTFVDSCLCAKKSSLCHDWLQMVFWLAHCCKNLQCNPTHESLWICSCV